MYKGLARTHSNWRHYWQLMKAGGGKTILLRSVAIRRLLISQCIVPHSCAPDKYKGYLRKQIRGHEGRRSNVPGLTGCYMPFMSLLDIGLDAIHVILYQRNCWCPEISWKIEFKRERLINVPARDNYNACLAFRLWYHHCFPAAATFLWKLRDKAREEDVEDLINCPEKEPSQFFETDLAMYPWLLWFCHTV